MAPIKMMYRIKMASVLGTLVFSIRLTTGFKRKYKKIEMRKGKNNVEIKVNKG